MRPLLSRLPRALSSRPSLHHPKPFSGMSDLSRPLESAIRTKLTTTFSPTKLEIRNDSHLHRHHAAMRDQDAPGEGTAVETHFHVEIWSEAFRGMNRVKRHREIYGLLKEEMSEGKVHALGLAVKDGEGK